MGLSIHTNYTSLVTQNTLNSTNKMLGTAMERLGTGFRINSAADDAAGLQIAVRLQAQTNGQGVAMRNSQDAISMMQTAEGAFDEITNITQRMKDLATQGANGTNSAAELKAMNTEFLQLGKEIANIMGNTSYGAGTNLLTDAGKFGAAAVSFQIGASTSETLSVDISAAVQDINAKSAITAGTAPAPDTTALGDLETDASAAIDTLNTFLGAVSAVRGQLGANINRLEHTITNLGNMRENGEAAKGRIMDADFATEASNMSKNQMLMQSGMSVLSNANQMSGLVMSLLR
ncbi:lateral flagellin LafA [Oceanimonas baumannii]|uniref:Flagellin n=1 Tax=Oceanimonas baumannii TaxID=129578 RepID=A0A235CMJ5_9GAMM|nr:lateral flagellin LafA [Oceanimonas baumannii]OYD25791.1 Lateral flagellin [Oceanimonas baumannii]TDW60198.1 flagellin [Oceanimonas baumannii]